MTLGVAPNEQEGRPEPSENSLRWLLDRDKYQPGVELQTTPFEEGSSPKSLFSADQGLDEVFRGHTPFVGAVVIGDTAADFALALAYDRMLGFGIWVGPELQETWQQVTRPTLHRRFLWLRRSAKKLSVLSCSMSDEEVSDLTTELRQSPFDHELKIGHEKVRTQDRDQLLVSERPTLGGGLKQFVIDEHIGTQVALPAVKTPDGSLEALTGLESPVPNKLLTGGTAGTPLPFWYVDASFDEDPAPRGRDVRNDVLQNSPGPHPEVNIRASRDGVTFSPESVGFIPAGAVLSARLGRPRIRQLSMLAWTRAMVAPHGLDVRLSAAGRKTEHIRTRAGDRTELLALAEPQTLGLLRRFVTREKTPKRAERANKDIVVLSHEPYLSFNAIKEATPLMESNQRLDLVDKLIVSRLLRRGLILDCAECGRPSFIDAGALGATFTCPQCAASNDLVSQRWKRSSEEPTWFYDLYAGLRDLLDANGDVVLLAARELNQQSRSYVDATELEFVDQDGKAIAEIDLVACVNGQVVIVEAKSSAKFGSGRGKQTDKLCKIASHLLADKIVLATNQSNWSETDVLHVRQEAARLGPFAIDVEVMAGLGVPDGAE